MTGPAVLVTRPEADSEALSAALAEAGWCPMIWPLLDIVPCAASPDASGVQAVLFTSANAARACPAASLAVVPPRCLCVGAKTAAAARAAGYLGVAAAGGDAEALADAVCAMLDPADGGLLFLRGTEVAGDLSGRLTRAGFTVREAVVYAAQAASAAPRPVAAALAAGRVAAALFFSPRSAAVFARLAMPFRDGLAATRAVAISARAAEPLTGLGFSAVSVAAAPRAEAMLEALGAPGRGDMRLGAQSAAPLG